MKRLELIMTLLPRRSVFTAILLAGFVASPSLFAADAPKEIRIDWATYNPVSMLLKDKGFLENEFAKDGTTIRWVQTVSSSNALQFLNAGSIDFGSTAGSAALVARINGNREQLEGELQAKYGYAKDKAKQEVDTWCERL